MSLSVAAQSPAMYSSLAAQIFLTGLIAVRFMFDTVTKDLWFDGDGNGDGDGSGAGAASLVADLQPTAVFGIGDILIY
jgi:hypothetical protein